MAKLLLSFDFEDWHQLVHRGLGHADWDSRGHALERQTAAIFELLDELGAKATFFVLGITAERYPDLVRAIAAKGHDLACHGYDHRRVPTQSRDEFKADVERCAELVEQLAGKRPRRATGRRRSRSPARPRGPTRCSPSSASATTRASTTRPASHSESAACREPRTGSSSTRDARSGSTRSPSGPSADARCRWAEARTGARCPPPCCAERSARSPPRTPTLCCTSIRTSSTRNRCGRRCPRARLRSSARSRPGRASSATRAGGWSRIGFVRSPATTR